jgi:glutamine synthetase
VTNKGYINTKYSARACMHDRRKIEPPDPVEEDVYGFDDRKLAKFYIKTLPENLGEAIEEFKRSKLMKETLGEHVFNKYLEIKTTEWNEYQKTVTDWELKRYRDL